MAWRGLHLTRPSRLSFENAQIVISQDDGEVRLALEDVAWIVLDSPRCSLTGTLLSACMVAGVVVVMTDETHTPCGLALPFHRHHRQADVARLQVEASEPLKKRLWQSIVRAKVRNQAAVLDSVGRDGGHTLHEMTRRVGSGDPDNVEAQAARHYWGRLWPKFRREDGDDLRNKMLNYGYAVIRSGIARAAVASGLLPAFGLKHASVTNAFNLADDLVEPLRPFVDALVWRVAQDRDCSGTDLTVDDRRAMASVLLADANLAGEILNLLTASERIAESLVRCLESRNPAYILLPAHPS